MAQLCHITVNELVNYMNILGEIAVIQFTLDKRYMWGANYCT